MRKLLVKVFYKFRNWFVFPFYKVMFSVERWTNLSTVSFGRGRFEAKVTVRGSIGRINIEDGFVLGSCVGARISNGEILIQAFGARSFIDIGLNSRVSNNVTLRSCDSIRIGKNFLCGESVLIIDSDFHGLVPNCRNEDGQSAPIIIGDNVWLGSRVIVLKGVHIGNNTVVSAGSIVTRSLPSNCVAAGVPAKIRKFL